MTMWRIAVLGLAFVARLPSAVADEPLRFRGTCMGTTYAVTVAGPIESSALAETAKCVSDQLERIEQIFSLYRPQSELSRLNAAEGGAWIPVSHDLLAVTKRALELAQETGGAVDPTVAPLVRLWRLRSAAAAWSPPTQTAIVETQKRTDFRKIEVRDKPPAIQKLGSGIELDLNALVEGWAIDRIIALLRQRGIQNVIVELGGEFGAIGAKPNGPPWKVGIENPLEPGSLYATAALANAALATSGNYRQAVEYRGRFYGHILDARTGRPVEHNLLAVSVVAGDAMTADGWATAFMALGPDEGFALAEKKGLAASFVMQAGAKIQVRLTEAALSAIRLKDG